MQWIWKPFVSDDLQFLILFSFFFPQMDKRGKSPYAGSWTLWQKRRVKTKVRQVL